MTTSRSYKLVQSNDAIARNIGGQIAAFLLLEGCEHNDGGNSIRYSTRWGAKTPLAIARTISEIIHQRTRL
jgi:hypothetical protein